MDTSQLFWNRAEVLASLNHVAGTRHLMIVAGAGVSMESQLPSWYDLIARLLGSVMHHGKSASEFEQAVLASEGLLGAGDIVKQSLVDFAGELRSELYEGNASPVPGPTALAIAALKKEWDANCSVVTTNYDDLLEQAISREYGRRALTWVSDKYRGDSPGVYHLHGYLPSHGEQKGDIVLGTSDYARLRDDSWQENKIRQGLTTRRGVILIVGSSLSDYNLLKFLYRRQKGKGAPRVVALMSPRHSNSPEAAEALTAYEKVLNQKWANAGVTVLSLDHRAQAAQFLWEIVLKRRSEADYKPYVERCAELEEMQDTRSHALCRAGGDIHDAQDFLNELLRELLAEINAVVPPKQRSGEIRAVHLYRRWFNERSVVQIASSDRTWETYDAYQPVPLTPDSWSLAAQAFSSGLVETNQTTPTSSRWEYQLAVPVFTSPTHRPYERIPVGVVLVTSSLPFKTTTLGKQMTNDQHEKVTSVIIQNALEILTTDTGAP